MAPQLLPYRIAMSEGEMRGALSGRRLNTIIVGSASETEAELANLTAAFDEQPYVWPDVPPLVPGAKQTLIIRNLVDRSENELRLLAALLDRGAAEIQVISTAPRSVWLAVANGRFPADLYYRLNVVVI